MRRLRAQHTEIRISSRRQHLLLQRIKQVVMALLPDAEVILYGSRARGDAKPDSDWDLLVLTDEVITPAREEEVWHRLYDIELDTGAVINAAVKNRREWSSAYSVATPYHRNVVREGRAI